MRRLETGTVKSYKMIMLEILHLWKSPTSPLIWIKARYMQSVTGEEITRRKKWFIENRYWENCKVYAKELCLTNWNWQEFMKLDMRLRSQLLTRFSSSNKGLEISTLFLGMSFIATFEFWNESRFYSRWNY